MHLRPAFTETDPDRIKGLIRAHPFGTLVTHLPDRGAEASHIPFAVREHGGGFTLHGHLAAGNAQCVALDGGSGLAVFAGPHAYVAPGWYEAQPAVPTWDYAAVHVHGVLSLVTNEAQIAADLQDMVFEELDPFRVDALPALYRARMFAGIRAFTLTPTRVEAQWKMSQNRSVPDRLGVIAGLRAQEDQGAGRVADLIAATLP